MLNGGCSDERIGELQRMAMEVALDQRDGARGDGFGDGQDGRATLVEICLEQFEFALVAHALHELYVADGRELQGRQGIQELRSLPASAQISDQHIGINEHQRRGCRRSRR